MGQINFVGKNTLSLILRNRPNEFWCRTQLRRYYNTTLISRCHGKPIVGYVWCLNGIVQENFEASTVCWRAVIVVNRSVQNDKQTQMFPRTYTIKRSISHIIVYSVNLKVYGELTWGWSRYQTFFIRCIWVAIFGCPVDLFQGSDVRVIVLIQATTAGI